MDDQQQGRLLLAIALSLMVLFGWSWVQEKFLSPPPPPAEERAAAPDPERPYQPADATAPAVAAGPEPVAPTYAPTYAPAAPQAEVPAPAPAPPVPTFAVVDTIVQTPLLRVHFSSRGAMPVSLQLVQFPTKAKRGGDVELIPMEMPGPEGMLPATPWALDLGERDGPRMADTVFDVREWAPGSDELTAALASLEPAFAPRASADPATLQADAEQTLRAAGVPFAIASALAAAAVDVPLSREGVLEAGWSVAARANRDALATAHVVDYRLPRPDGSVLHKVYVVDADRYSLSLTVALENRGIAPAEFGGGAGYQLFWGPGLLSSEGPRAQDPLQFAWVHEGSLKQETPGIGIMTRVGGFFGLTTVPPIPPPIDAPPGADWFSLRRKYFMAGVRPMFTGTHARLVPLAKTPPDLVEMQVTAPPLVAGAGGIAAHRYVICASPIRRAELAAVGHDFGLAVNFGWVDLFGKAMLAGLLLFNGMVHNYGIAIILLTVLVRLGLYPLNQKAYQSMRAMSVMQPKINEVRERYKNDPQEMNKRIWAMYRENNINPMGGCLPIAFQMPIFIALFYSLRGAIELRGADFLWIVDLSEPDRLAMLPGGFALNILPILMIGAMVAQQRMSTPPANPTNDPNVEMQRKMMTYMPLIFGVMFYGMPAGLTLYWLVSTLLGIGQQYYINKA